MKSYIKHIALLAILLFSMTSCLITEGVSGNKKVISQERNTNDTFTKIKVKNGLTVYIKRDTEEKITVEADENIQDIILTKIDKGTLHIYCEKNIRVAKARNVYVSLPKTTSIEVNDGSRVISENTIITDSLTIKSSGGSSIELQLIADSLKSESSSGSSINLKGKTQLHKTNASSGGNIDAYEFKAVEVIANASSGAQIKVTATEKIKGNASSGGNITYKGNPKTTDKDTSSGGNISPK